MRAEIYISSKGVGNCRPKTSNNIIQKGLAFPRKQSASVTSSG